MLTSWFIDIEFISAAVQGSRRKLGIFDGNVNTTGPIEPDESETEMTLGFLKVDFTDADGLPIYTNHTDIEKEINELKLLPCVTFVEQDGEVKALDFSTNVKEGKKVERSSLRGQTERVLAEEVTWGIEMVSYRKLRRKVLAAARRSNCDPTFDSNLRYQIQAQPSVFFRLI